MLLSIPPEPIEIRNWISSLRQHLPSESSKKEDTVIWTGNKLPKYLWDSWKNDLKLSGITWQKFMRILNHRTDVGIMWYQGSLPWADFVKRVIELIEGPIGKEASIITYTSESIFPLQDIGSIQIPAISDWEEFERFCRDLWAKIWENPQMQINGRTGQKQAGVDVYGEIKKGTPQGGIQCKRRDAFADHSITIKEFRQIVEDAKKFKPALSEFVIAYTGKNDAKLKAEARRLSELNTGKGFFSVKLCSWDDIKDMLGNYPELLEKYNLVTTGASTKFIEEIKRTSDSMLESQIKSSEDIKDIAQNVSSVKEKMDEITKHYYSVGSGGDITSEYSSEIDEIRDLINTSRPKEALVRIEVLEKRMGLKITDTIKFRLHTNKAAALASLGEEEKAGILFIEAFQYNPEDEKALCNKSLGHLFIGQREEAIKLVKQILHKNPFSQRANELLAYTAPTTESLQSIIEQIPEILRKNESVANAIAHAANERKMEYETIRWLEIAVENSDPNKPTPDIMATLATAILQSFEKRYDVQSGMQVTSTDKKQLNRVISLLDNAIGALENSETLKYRVNWIGNRAIAHKLLGNKDKALSDAEFAIKLAPNNPGFLRQKAFLLHEQGKSEEAIIILKQILNNPETPEVALLLAGIFLERGDDDSAISILEKSIQSTDKVNSILSEEKRLLIYGYMHKNQFDSARNLADELRTTNPGSVTDLVVAARIEKRAGNFNVQNQLLNDARTYVSDNTPLRSLFELADELYDSKRYADAWPIYEKLIDPRNGSLLISKLIYSYYESEMYEKALEAARSVPEKDKDRFIYDIEVSILDSMGNLKSAIITSEEYILKNPEDLAFKIKWATYLLRDDQLEKLDNFLNNPIDLNQLSADLMFNATRQLAWLYTQRNMPARAIEVAYILRKNSPRNGNAHTTYMSIFFDIEKSLGQQFSPKSVEIDTAIAIEEDGRQKRWYVIEENPGNDKDTLSPNDPFAKKLIGKKVNDEIVQDKGEPSESKLKIIEIKSKYIHALHETMEIFPYLFGEDDRPPIKRFTIKTDPNAEEETGEQIKKILDATTNRNEYISRVQKLYHEGEITIGTFSNLIGRDPIIIWMGLTNNPNIGIRCCDGNPEERQDAIKTIETSKTVAVDLTAFLTLAIIDQLDLLRSNFEKIFVSQSTIDILTEEISQKIGIESKGFMTIWTEGKQYLRQEITEEDVQKRIAFLKKIKYWIINNCTVATMTEIIKLPKEQREQLYKTLGISFVDTMMIAKGNNCPIYSDDHGTRHIALTNYKVRGFWTQILAFISARNESITTDNLEIINTSLCKMHYRHTIISGKTLLYAAKSSGWTNTGVFTEVLAGISGRNIEIKSAISTTVDFFFQLWKEPTISDLQREGLVFTTIDAITQQKNRVEVINFLGALVPIRFHLTPITGKHILRLLTAWRSIRN